MATADAKPGEILESQGQGRLPSVIPPGDQKELRLAMAIRLTAFGAQVSIAAVVALSCADLASQSDPRHAALIFGVTGGTVAMVVGRLLRRFFGAFGRT